MLDWIKRYHPNPDADQPLFVCLRGPSTGARLTGSGVYKLIRRVLALIFVILYSAWFRAGHLASLRNLNLAFINPC